MVISLLLDKIKNRIWDYFLLFLILLEMFIGIFWRFFLSVPDFITYLLHGHVLPLMIFFFLAVHWQKYKYVPDPFKKITGYSLFFLLFLQIIVGILSKNCLGENLIFPYSLWKICAVVYPYKYLHFYILPFLIIVLMIFHIPGIGSFKRTKKKAQASILLLLIGSLITISYILTSNYYSMIYNRPNEIEYAGELRKAEEMTDYLTAFTDTAVIYSIYSSEYDLGLNGITTNPWVSYPIQCQDPPECEEIVETLENMTADNLYRHVSHLKRISLVYPYTAKLKGKPKVKIFVDCSLLDSGEYDEGFEVGYANILAEVGKTNVNVTKILRGKTNIYNNRFFLLYRKAYAWAKTEEFRNCVKKCITSSGYNKVINKDCLKSCLENSINSFYSDPYIKCVVSIIEFNPQCKADIGCCDYRAIHARVEFNCTDYKYQKTANGEPFFTTLKFYGDIYDFQGKKPKKVRKKICVKYEEREIPGTTCCYKEECVEEEEYRCCKATKCVEWEEKEICKPGPCDDYGDNCESKCYKTKVCKKSECVKWDTCTRCKKSECVDEGPCKQKVCVKKEEREIIQYVPYCDIGCK